MLSSYEQLFPCLEACQALLSELGEALLGLFLGLYLLQIRLAIELVGIANDLLLRRFGQEILVREGQVLRGDVVERQSGACVALAHSGVAFVALASQEFGSDAAVADVGFRAMAGNAWRIATEDADVV